MLEFYGEVELSAVPGAVFDFFLNEIESLPEYMDNKSRDINCVQVLERKQEYSELNGELTSYITRLTRWNATLQQGEGSAIIEWVEKDSFLQDDRNGVYNITFDLVEDKSPRSCIFQTLQGTWGIENKGNKTVIKLFFNCGLPGKGFEEEFGNYIGDLILKNTKGLLCGLQNRFNGTKKEPVLNFSGLKTQPSIGQSDQLVFLLGHAGDKKHLHEIITRKYNENKGNALSKDQVETISNISSLFPTHITDTFSHIEDISVFYVTCPFLVGHDSRLLIKKRLVEAFELAEKYENERMGNCIISLGGFTSIYASQSIREEYEKKEVFSTSGSFFTAASIYVSIVEAAEILNYNLTKCTIAIVGAGGAIGSKLSVLLSRRCKELRLTGRSKRKLRHLVSNYCLENAVAYPDQENRRALRGAHFVITITNSIEPIIATQDCEYGAVICDAGYPKNVINTHSNSKNVFVVPGGLGESPWPLDFSIYNGLDSTILGNRVVYGCWAEGMILGLEARENPNVLGFESQMLKEVDQIGSPAIVRGTNLILNLGAKYGFKPMSIRKFIERAS